MRGCVRSVSGRRRGAPYGRTSHPTPGTSRTPPQLLLPSTFQRGARRPHVMCQTCSDEKTLAFHSSYTARSHIATPCGDRRVPPTPSCALRVDGSWALAVEGVGCGDGESGLAGELCVPFVVAGRFGEGVVPGVLPCRPVFAEQCRGVGVDGAEVGQCPEVPEVAGGGAVAPGGGFGGGERAVGRLGGPALREVESATRGWGEMQLEPRGWPARHFLIAGVSCVVYCRMPGGSPTRQGCWCRWF